MQSVINETNSYNGIGMKKRKRERERNRTKAGQARRRDNHHQYGRPVCRRHPDDPISGVTGEGNQKCKGRKGERERGREGERERESA